MDDKISSLLEWLRQDDEFYLNECVEIKDTVQSGRGVYLDCGELKLNTPIVSIPGDYQLNKVSVLSHISHFNNAIQGSIGNTPIKDASDYYNQTNDDDPRYKAYKLLTTSFLEKLSSFQLLSMYILAEWFLLPHWSNGKITSFWKPFFECWPTNEELSTIPTIWALSDNPLTKELLNHLPETSKTHVNRISTLVSKDWEVLQNIFEVWSTLHACPTNDNMYGMDEIFNFFLRIYFTINSRCLYAEIPGNGDDTASNFTLVPYVNFFNHTVDPDVHCYPRVKYMKKGKCGIGKFEIYCGRYSYKDLDEQLYLNYGAHSNDFLLNEYGFLISNNHWNNLDISKELKCILAKSPETVAFLKEWDYWDDYTISVEDISYRIIIALSHLTTRDNRKVTNLINGYMSEDYFRKENYRILKNLLEQLKLNSISKITQLNKLTPYDDLTTLYVRNIANLYEDEIEIINTIITSISPGY